MISLIFLIHFPSGRMNQNGSKVDLDFVIRFSVVSPAEEEIQLMEILNNRNSLKRDIRPN